MVEIRQTVICPKCGDKEAVDTRYPVDNFEIGDDMEFHGLTFVDLFCKVCGECVELSFENNSVPEYVDPIKEDDNPFVFSNEEICLLQDGKV